MARDRIVLYGTLRRGGRPFRDLGLAARLSYSGPCRFRGDLYDLGAYPGYVDGRGRVSGELYEIADRGVLAILDTFEGVKPDDPVASLYVRARIDLLTPPGTAWVYRFNRPVHGHRRIPSGVWRTRRPRLSAPPGRAGRAGGR